MNNVIRITIFLLLINISLTAQDSLSGNIQDNNLQQNLELLSESTLNEENDYTNLLDNLNYYKSHPINLNDANYEELQQLGLLNDIQINNLLDYIQENGSLMVIYEIQLISGFDENVINKILPYVYVSENNNREKIKIKNIVKGGQHLITIRSSQLLEEQKGFSQSDSATVMNSPNSRFLGSPQKLYARYNYNFNNKLSYGLTAEKDEGELLLKDNKKIQNPIYDSLISNKLKNGFDFYSAHFFYKNSGFIKSVAVGDYQVAFGQGLTAWSGLAFGKNYDVTSIKRIPSGIRPYKSVDENRFMRGIATTLCYKKVEVSLFTSYKKVDANIVDTTGEGNVIAYSSLQQTGYHNTFDALYDKHSVQQAIAGGNVSYKSRRLSLGITALTYSLSGVYNKKIYPYNQFEFSSVKNFNAGIDYNYVFQNFNFFGENAVSENGAHAFLDGLLIVMNERLSFSVFYRNYPRNYQNLFSNAISQNTFNSNENGLFMSTSIGIIKNMSLYTYYDIYKFPWLKYQVNQPSLGHECVVQLNANPSKKMNWYLRYRNQYKEENVSVVDAPIKYTVPVSHVNYRLHINYVLTPFLKLANRLEFVEYQKEGEQNQKGYLMYQDIIYNKAKSPFTLTLRYALFHTDSYDARVYAYENDVQGAYSIPSFYYRGSRFYFLVNYTLNKFVEIWLRYSQTYYDNKNTISEGTLNEISGNTKSEIKAQVAFKF